MWLNHPANGQGTGARETRVLRSEGSYLELGDACCELARSLEADARKDVARLVFQRLANRKEAFHRG